MKSRRNVYAFVCLSAVALLIGAARNYIQIINDAARAVVFDLNITAGNV